jgi:hypothetical protein
MADHDQRFKILLQTFFQEFLDLFFPQWAQRFDCSRVEWLEKEVFTDPPQGERRYLDLVAKLPTREVVPPQREGEQESWIALIHVEIEYADTVQPLRARMHDYYEQLRRQHHLPVLPIALYLCVGLNGLGIDGYEEHFWDFRPLHFEYLYVGLPGLSAEDYLTRDNWLAVALAALMDIPADRRAWLTAEALNRLVSSPETDQRRYLLCECVQAYAPLEDRQWQQLERLLVSEPYRRLQPMATTYLEKREALAHERGQRQMIQTMLEERFGPLNVAVRERLQAWPADQLTNLARAFVKAQSLKELGLEE